MEYVNTDIAHLIKTIGKNVFITEDAEGLVLQLDAFPKLEPTGTDTYVVAASGYSLTSYANTGFIIKIPNTNTTSSTLNIDGVAATSIKKGGTTDVGAGDLVANKYYFFFHDGTYWQVIGLGGSGGGGSGDVVGPSSAVDSNVVLFDMTTGKLIKDSGKAHSTDGTLASNSDAKIPTEKAVKTYIDNAVTGLLELKGSTDCSANPNYPAASKGDSYYVTVAGKIGGASGKSVDVGDVYVASADNAGGTEASVGTSWFVLEHNLVGALLAANNLSDLANAGTARTNLGATSVGSNIFTLSNPSAIRWIRINADNSVSTRTAAETITDLGFQDDAVDMIELTYLRSLYNLIYR